MKDVDFLDAIPDSYDLASLLDPQVQDIESTAYDRPFIYKYYPPQRRDFFEKLTVRLSPKEALNDPFEMSERWKEIRTDGLRAYLRSRLQETLPKLLADEKYLARQMREYLSESGAALSDEQERSFEAFFASDEARAFVISRLPSVQALTLAGVDHVFDRVEEQFQQMVDRIVSKMGVLSLTEDAANQQMWAHYAAKGSGFVIGFDAQDPLFRHRGASQQELTKKGSLHRRSDAKLLAESVLSLSGERA